MANEPNSPGDMTSWSYGSRFRPAKTTQPGIKPAQDPPERYQDSQAIRSRDQDEVPGRAVVVLDGRHAAEVNPEPDGGHGGRGQYCRGSEYERRFQRR